MIKNNVGQSTGKVVLTYKDEKVAKEAVNLYNDNAVNDMVCSAKPFLEPG